MLTNQVPSTFGPKTRILDVVQQQHDKVIFNVLHKATALAAHPVLCSRFSHLDGTKIEISDFMDGMSYQVAGGMWATIISRLHRQHSGKDISPHHLFSSDLLSQIHSDLSHFGLTPDDIVIIMQETFKDLLKDINSPTYLLPAKFSMDVPECKNYLKM